MTNDGKELERLVRLIEQSISPSSVVEHNVNLPVIGSKSGRTRQCDVVIRSGQKSRETITIVEVQDRGTQTDITTFGGWLDKIKRVGAQHLICVSRLDFPVSIKEQAFKLGGTVKLITLKEVGAEDIPINVISEHNHTHIQKIKDMKIDFSQSGLLSKGEHDALKKIIGKNNRIDTNEKYWSLDKNERVSLNKLCIDFMDSPVGKVEGEDKIVFDINKDPKLYMLIEDIFFRVGLDLAFEWAFESTEIPISIISYEQNEDGILAWVAEIFYKVSKGKLSVKIPIVKMGELYRVYAQLGENLPPDTTISFEKIQPPSSTS